MALMGVSAGAGTVIYGALWAELYGSDFLGEIRALATSLMVLATAISPVLIGIMIDFGVGLETQLIILCVCTISCTTGLFLLAPKLSKSFLPFLKA